MFPAPFARVHGKRRTPVFGLVVSSVLVTGLMLMNYTKGLVDAFEFVILLATLTTLVPYAFSAAAQAWLWLVERETFQPQHLVRDTVDRGARVRLQRVGDRRRRRRHRHQGLRPPAGRHPGLRRRCAGGSAASARAPGRCPSAASRPPVDALGATVRAEPRRGSTSGRRSARCGACPAPARPRAQAPDAAQQGRRCCSTTCCGSSAPARSTTRSPTRSPSAASRCSTCSDLLAETLEHPDDVARRGARRARSPPSTLGPAPRPGGRRVAGVARAAAELARAADRRHRARRAAVRQRRARRAGAARRRLRARRRCPTTCSRATRRRGSTAASRQRDGEAARGGARAIHLRRDLPPPSAVRRRAARDLERRPRRPGRSSRAATCSSIGSGCVLIGMGERTRPGAVELLAERLFAAGAAERVIAVAMPARRSAMHLDTVMTMVDGDAFTIYPEHPRRAGRLHAATRRATASRRARGRPVRRDRPRARRAARCGCSRPAATPTRPSASSGTTATTSSPSRPASSSPTSATSTPTRACAAPASRSSRSPAPSSGRGRGGPRCMSCPIEREDSR